MNRWRVLLVGALVVVPFVVLACLGSWYLWTRGLTIVVWWPLTLSMILGYLLAWHWQRRQRLLRPVETAPPLHWTDRDRDAWSIVEAKAKKAATMDTGELTELQVYVNTARELALDLAKFYHPGSTDPVSALTIPEILAVTELAARDLANLADEYLPGGHLLRIRDWRRARQVTEWYQTASNVYWLISAMFSPVNTGLRYLASRAGMTRPWQLLQRDLIAWFYAAYVHRVGAYLIDLNSGRLRVGARRYRELRDTWQPPIPATALPGPSPSNVEALDGVVEARDVTMTVIGQVKAGKSSFINALLGEQRARTDIVPATRDITQYRLRPEGIGVQLSVYDTAGYGHEGPAADQIAATEEMARASDLILLVLHARSPARQADALMLTALRQWFATQPNLRMPPVLGVMTHIDLLSPTLEWNPPYDWVRPRRTKETQIAEARNAVHEQLGDHLAGLVPLCTAPGKVYGVEEWLLPALAKLLDEAHAVAFLRCLHAEANQGQARKLLRQLLQVATQAAEVLWTSYQGRLRP